MSRSTVVKYLHLTFDMAKLSILSAMEYRTSFLTQVFGMVLNDAGILLLWYFFFQKFSQVNGWGFNDSLMLFAISTVNGAIVMIFAGGLDRMARQIAQGELDNYLTLPKNILWQIAVSKTDISALGDLIFGVIAFVFTGNITMEKVGIFIFLSIVTAYILINFLIITQSIGFFVGNFEDAAERMMNSLEGITLYPQSPYFGLLKIFMMTVLPAFFVANIPVRLMNHFDIRLVFELLGASIVMTIFAYLIFKKGLKQYESGNLINVKM